MRHRLSLRFLLLLVFLFCTLALVFGYTLLTARYFMQGMDSIIAGSMEQAAANYLQSRSGEIPDGLVRVNGFQLTARWDQLPFEIRQAYGTPPIQANQMVKHEEGSWHRPEEIRFLLRYQDAEAELFVVNRVTRETSSPLVGRYARQGLRFLLVLGSIVMVALGISVWALYRHISRPVVSLAAWARDLTPKQLAQDPPVFVYPELNSLASLVRQSLRSVQEVLHASTDFCAIPAMGCGP